MGLEYLIFIIPSVMLLTLFFGARRKFLRYAESVMAMNSILDAAMASGYYKNISILRVENNGGVPRLGHNIYFTCIEHRTFTYSNWKEIFKKWIIDRYGCELILDSYISTSVVHVVADGMGTIRTLMELEHVSAFGTAILKEYKGKELYLLVAGFAPDKKELPFSDFEVLSLKLKNVFKK